MTGKELIKLISGGENLNVEFKQIFSGHEKTAKEIIAFANTSGGKIIFGIKDSGKIIGVHSEKEITELINETINNYTEPKIEFKLHYIEIETKEVVVLEIPESKNKPHRIQDYLDKINYKTAQVYIRVNDKSVPASIEMMKLLRNQTEQKPLINYRIGSIEKKVFEYLEKNERISVRDLTKYTNISPRRASRTLIKLVQADVLIIHTKDNGEEFYTASTDISKGFEKLP